MVTTSESLLLRLRNRIDNQAWSQFVRLYTPLLFYWARNTGLRYEDAADLVQDVLTVLFQKLPGFEYDSQKSFRSWLRTITINKFREHTRRKSVSREAVTGSMVEQVIDDASLETSWDHNYRESLFQSALKNLQPEFPPATWAAVREYMTTGRPAAEIAQENGLSVWTIYGAKSRLLARLREHLDGLFE